MSILPSMHQIHRQTLTAIATSVAGLLLTGVVAAQSVTTDIGTLDKATAERSFPTKAPYSPYAGRNYPTQPFFGDTHVHTAFSMDAGAFGARLSPKDAYRFARGEQITASSGQPVKLSRPLDFLVVADHSDNMGFFPDLLAGKPDLLADPQGRRWYDMIQSGKGADAAIEIIMAFSQGTLSQNLMYTPDSRAYRSAWQETIKAAEAVQQARPLHRLHRLRMDVQHRRQQPAPQRHLPRQRRQGQPGRCRSRYCRRAAATTRATCGSGWPTTRPRPAATCWPSRTTATSATA